MRTEHTEVLIVGAGPTGLTLACDLARRGVRAVLVERSSALFPGSRGKGLQPRSLEVLEDLGVLDRILAAGSPYPEMMNWHGGERLGTWQLAAPRPARPGVPHPEMWLVPQWRTQEILYERLLELGGAVRFDTALVALEQDADRVSATLESADGPLTVAADYLVAADGGRSAVRRAVGVTMIGGAVDPLPSLVADLRVTGLDRDNWHVWPKAAGGPAMLCPLPGTDDFQFFARFEEGEPDTGTAAVRAAVAARTHLPAEAVTEVRWASDFRPRAALAERFREGRVFLAGDAAHIHSPAGGQGLNTGLQDAYNLGWKLDRVLRHGAPEELLDSYQAERLPIAADVLEISTALHRGAFAADPGSGPASEPGRLVRRGEDTDQLAVGYRGGPLTAERRGGLDDAAPLRAGDRAPDAELPGGGRLFEVLAGPHFTLVAGGCEPPAVPAGVRSVRLDAEVYGRGLFLVRPDGYVGLATHDPAELPGWFAAVGVPE
ncbi:FAD-dependent monooxygenase [Kitasatospora cinereorecta]|uniref:FAD-dependent monooxygenase n=1 Tax=Kitasatospora cinereorecta TaxID=285560 RepID=A0ABW0VC56_9ACTN